ncbi:MAG: HAMP domain-containing protein [Candidatus Sericytochromatia bacterium]|nr:HAMP domain-containing protein [Candidatus Sericytochromatia bacterium]
MFLKFGGLSMTYEILILLAIAIITSLTLAYMLTKAIVLPIQDLNNAMIDTKDLTVRVKVNRKDEIGQLADKFNNYIEHLSKTIQQIAFSSSELSENSKHLSNSTDQTGKATEQVATSIQFVAEGGTKLVEHVETANRAVSIIIQAVNRVVINTRELLAYTDQVDKVSTACIATVQKATIQMEEIQLTVGNSSLAIQALGEQSSQIGRIVETITTIASQTNLLALNAAIEAARAGEQGKGFAVVAAEVRKLAEESAQAAYQIGDIVKSIQSLTEKSIISMLHGTEEVSQGVEIIKETEMSLDKINSSVKETLQRIQVIDLDVKNLSGSSQTIVKTMDQVFQVAENNASIAEQVAASAEEQTASVHQIGKSVSNITQLAYNLEGLANQFKFEKLNEEDKTVSVVKKARTARLVN